MSANCKNKYIKKICLSFQLQRASTYMILFDSFYKSLRYLLVTAFCSFYVYFERDLASSYLSQGEKQKLGVTLALTYLSHVPTK